MKPPSEREIQIGQRLRAFREAKRISRTAFALSIRIGSERLASYEAGRVPLRFEVFKAISQEYSINPIWLATGEGTPSLSTPFQLGEAEALVPSSMPFSQAYDSHLDSMCRDQYRHGRVLIEQYLDSVGNLSAFLKQNPEEKIPAEVAEGFYSGLLDFTSEALEVLRFQQALERRVKKLRAHAKGSKEKVDRVLTDTSEFRKGVPMKTALQELLGKLNGLTKARGMKAKVASHLGVPQSRISAWLAGRYEPSG